MIFVDTNIWMEAIAFNNPDNDSDKEKVIKATNFLRDNAGKIITCKEQMIEFINAIQKAKRKEFSKQHKKATGVGIKDIKDFRRYSEYEDVVRLCKSCCNDMLEMAYLDENFSYNVDEIIASLKDADINDIMYFNYCLNKGFKLYTLDHELASMDDGRGIVYLI